MTKIVHQKGAAPPPTEAFNEPRAEDPAVGKWYWHTTTDYEDKVHRSLACITHMGSNYVLLESVYRSDIRVHLDHFWSECKHEPNPEKVIHHEIEGHQTEVKSLLGKVRELTDRLAITSGLSLQGASETQALALRVNDQPVDQYKAALILAKKETLPELFREIENANNLLACWMKAPMIPLKAQAEGLKTSIKAIDSRIFSVELYAGLIEQVVQVREGAPAEMTEKIHLLQRRAYMDEECLARYETGGMTFENIGAFDRWLARSENMERILPFPRCIIAFRVRRNMKEFRIESMADIIKFFTGEDAEKKTFLYLRNGDQLFRLSTGIEFGSKLFPDMSNHRLNQGKLWARIFAGRVDKKDIITDADYQTRVADDEAHEAEVEKMPKGEQWHHRRSSSTKQEYQPFTPDSVYYDDIAKVLKEEMDQHNRLVLVLQGLLDRSPVFHPHPPWAIWSNDGFAQGLTLVYDDSRALTVGDRPDFETYRARLNASLKVGSITVGQEDAWEAHEAHKENERRQRDSRGRDLYTLKRHRPHGNPGPGLLAWPAKATATKCTFEWDRPRSSDAWRSDAEPEIRCTLTVEKDKLLNVSAYKPGDFRQFFDDPRTRADYLHWAPLLLEAEEYHAGNREVQKPAAPKAPRERDPEAAFRYQERKKWAAFLGQAVRLTRRITTKGDTVYEKGSLWRVTDKLRGDSFTIEGIGPDGKREVVTEGEKSRYVSHVECRSFEVDPTIPAKAKKT